MRSRQTGAFEVYLGGELLHSKQATGVLPEINALSRMIFERNPSLSDAALKTAALGA